MCVHMCVRERAERDQVCPGKTNKNFGFCYTPRGSEILFIVMVLVVSLHFMSLRLYLAWLDMMSRNLPSVLYLGDIDDRHIDLTRLLLQL